MSAVVEEQRVVRMRGEGIVGEVVDMMSFR